MRDVRFVAPASRPAVADPELVRPDSRTLAARDPRLLWLDKNESTDPELAATFTHVVSNVLSNLGSRALSSYPDCAPLYSKLANQLGLPVESLFLAAGSDGVIRSVFEAFISPGDLVIHPAPTFAMYPVYARMYGAKTHALEYRPSPTGPVLLLETVVSAIANDHPKLVCLPNPDSPTGSVFDPTSLRRIVEAAGEAGALILIDEAYHPFYEETALPWTKAFGHLVVARTFAKAWGLAGLRIGYAAAAPEVANLLHKVRPMYEVNTVAVVAMERILDHEDAMRSSVRRLNEGRDYFIAEMETLGFRTVHCKGNFLHVAFGEMASSIHAALKDTVLYRQNASEPCLKGFTRFSATTTTLFRPIVSVISRIVARENGHTPGGH